MGSHHDGCHDLSPAHASMDDDDDNDENDLFLQNQELLQWCCFP